MQITSLTPEQKARFPEWVDKWIEIGLSTQPADFVAAQEAALRAYKLIEQPGCITTQRIQAEKNAEVRRVMIERYGQARYLVDSGAKEIHRDDFGILYRKDIPGDEPLMMVKVVNSTPEPDGSFKDYFIRVPPSMERAHQAVAWTFGKTEADYAPLVET